MNAPVQHHHRARLVARGEQHQVCGLDERTQLPLREKAVEAHLGGQSELGAEPLNLPLQYVLADHVQVKSEAGCTQQGQCPQQRRLVLHRIQAGDVDQARRDSRHARLRGPRGPGGQVHPERQPLRVDAQGLE